MPERGEGCKTTCVTDGVWIAAASLPLPQVRLLPATEPITRKVFAVSRRGGDRKPAVRVVLDVLAAQAATLRGPGAG